jgi:hypothetical protein
LERIHKLADVEVSYGNAHDFQLNRFEVQQALTPTPEGMTHRIEVITGFRSCLELPLTVHGKQYQDHKLSKLLRLRLSHARPIWQVGNL